MSPKPLSRPLLGGLEPRRHSTPNKRQKPKPLALGQLTGGRKPRRLLALDTETTGADLWHGCRPFFVSVMDEDGNLQYWEWDVHPETREVGYWDTIPGDRRNKSQRVWVPLLPPRDRDELTKLIEENDFVLHNTKFDCRALELSGFPRLSLDTVHDTLIASHCLVSNESHKLKDLAIQYLDTDNDDEKDLEVATNEARRIARQLGWAIATGPHPHFPAEKFKGKKDEDKKWKYDTWVPRAVARYKWEIEGDEEFNPKNNHPWWTVLRTYGLRDVERTYPLWLFYKDALEKEGLWDVYLERRKLLESLYALDSHGVSISTKRLKKLQKQLSSEGDAMHDKCIKLACHKIDNLASQKQLTGVLYGNMGVKPIKLTDGGIKKAKQGLERELSDYSTKAEVLITILDRIHPENKECYLPPRKQRTAYDFIWNLLGYRGRDKLQEYLEEYVLRGIKHGKEFINLYGSVNPTGSDTLRFTMSKPSLQVVSKGNQKRPDDPIPGIRGVFGPEPGREWYSIDFSNIELRIFSYESGDQALIQAYEQGYAVHCIFAKLLWEKEYKQCEKEVKGDRKKAEALFKDRYYETLYQWVKNGNFSLIYGAGEARADSTYHRPGAYRLIRQRMPLIDEFMQSKNQEARRYGYITTLGGYRLWVPASEPHVAVNYFVQGSAGWGMVLAVNRVHQYLKSLNSSLFNAPDKRGLDVPGESGYNMIMTIHDELVFDFPIHKRNNQVIGTIAKLMEQSGDDIGVPTPVEVSHHPTDWASENKEFKLAI